MHACWVEPGALFWAQNNTKGPFTHQIHSEKKNKKMEDVKILLIKMSKKDKADTFWRVKKGNSQVKIFCLPFNGIKVDKTKKLLSLLLYFVQILEMIQTRLSNNCNLYIRQSDYSLMARVIWYQLWLRHNF